jgi:hypothetical protein
VNLDVRAERNLAVHACHRLPAEETETAMCADLTRLLPPAAVPGDLEVTRVTTPAQLADYATVLAANWDRLRRPCSGSWS